MRIVSLKAIAIAIFVLAAMSTVAPAQAARPRGMALRPLAVLDPRGPPVGAAFGTSVAVDGGGRTDRRPVPGWGTGPRVLPPRRYLAPGHPVARARPKPNDFFGGAVAVNAGAIVVGAEGHGRGRVYVFSKGRQGWPQRAELSAGTGSRFGTRGSVVVVGDPGCRAGAGCAYVFSEDPGRMASDW
jgi:FG-GAP repeat